MHHHISTTKSLEDFCRQIESSEFITIDTEFFREVTYYPKLCIIQIANNDRAVIIDALSKDIDLAPLNSILQDNKIVKIFHSGKQDLEIIYNLYGQLPKNIFDTQIAASFCGFSNISSYESLVLEISHANIDKSYCVSDWTRRPLEPKQVEYALADVTYLRDIYLELTKRLKDNNRYTWAMEDIEELNQVSNFIINYDQVWRKIKNLNGLKPSLLLQKLAAWREVKAKEHNLPRNHYLHEADLIKLVQVMPVSPKELRSVAAFRNIEPDLANELTDIIQQALAEQCENELNYQYEEQANIPKFAQVMTQLKDLLEKTAQDHKLPSNLIATSAELKNICNKGYSAKLLTGWRSEVFGKEALMRKVDILNKTAHLAS